MRMAKATDGEAFGMLTANPQLTSPVKLDVQLVEADRVTTPAFGGPGFRPSALDFGKHHQLDNGHPKAQSQKSNAYEADGIEFDAFGNPVAYFVLREHPGGTRLTCPLGAYDRIPAESMIHWFRADRPGPAGRV